MHSYTIKTHKCIVAIAGFEVTGILWRLANTTLLNVLCLFYSDLKSETDHIDVIGGVIILLLCKESYTGCGEISEIITWCILIISHIDQSTE